MTNAIHCPSGDQVRAYAHTSCPGRTIGSRRVTLYPLFHPAAALRTPAVKEKLEAAVRELRTVLADRDTVEPRARHVAELLARQEPLLEVLDAASLCAFGRGVACAVRSVIPEHVVDRPLIAAWRRPRPLKSEMDSYGSASLPVGANSRPRTP